MIADQFRNWIERRDLNVARAAEILGVDRHTADRWLTGEREIPRAVETECRLLSGKIRLYELRPKSSGLDSVHWRASTLMDVVRVRAPSRRTARQYAALRFGRSACHGADGGEALRVPWLDDSLVELVIIEPTEAMARHGPLGVIEVAATPDDQIPHR